MSQCSFGIWYGFFISLFLIFESFILGDYSLLLRQSFRFLFSLELFFLLCQCIFLLLTKKWKNIRDHFEMKLVKLEGMTCIFIIKRLPCPNFFFQTPIKIVKHQTPHNQNMFRNVKPRPPNSKPRKKFERTDQPGANSDRGIGIYSQQNCKNIIISHQ